MIRAFAKYYVYWLVFFLIQKPLFMLVSLPLTGDITWLDWLLVPVHAFPLDLSVASYLSTFVRLHAYWISTPGCCCSYACAHS